MTKTKYESKYSFAGLFLIVALLIGVVIQISGCSNTPATGIKDLELSSNYEITAALDPESKTLDYTARIQIRNAGHDIAKELYFHLYGNLFKTETEGIAVNSVTDERGNAISYKLSDHDQLICLTLNNALAGGKETTVVIACTATIPDMISVFGVARYNEIHLPFFNPELAVYEKKRMEHQTFSASRRRASFGDVGLYANDRNSVQL